jgi:hypothetical protein
MIRDHVNNTRERNTMTITINGKAYEISTAADTTTITAQQGKTNANTLKAAARALRIDIDTVDGGSGTITTRDETAAMMIEAFGTRT